MIITDELDDTKKVEGSTGKGATDYLSGISGMIAPVTTDIKGVYDEYNQKIQTPLEQNFNVANYNELANLGPAYMDMSGYKKMSGKDIFIDSQFIGAAEGAAAGMSLGPWGALGGAISGNAMHLWKDLAHNNAGFDNYQSQVNSFNTRQIQNYNNNLTSSLDRLNYDYMKNQKVNYALGGEMLGQPTNQVTEFNTGGSHETNPYGGIPQGFGMNNMQNTVEEGEVKYNNFIFSKRVYPTKAILSKFNLPVSYFGLSIADIAKRLNKEGKERPSDPISNKGKDAMYERLQQAQEMQKISNEAAKNNMSVEEYMMAVQQQQSQQPQEQQNQFAEGGSLDGPGDPPFTQQDATRVQQNNLPYNHPINQQKAIEAFLQEYIKQTAYMNPAQVAEFNKSLSQAEQAVINNIPQKAFTQARTTYVDNQVGTITKGKEFNWVQDWWRDFTQTQKGQEIVKFIHDPIINQLVMPISGSATMGLMGAGLIDSYGQGADASEVGKEAALDVATMLIMGKILGGKTDYNKLGISQGRKSAIIPGKQNYKYNMGTNKYFTPSNKPNSVVKPNSKQVTPYEVAPQGGIVPNTQGQLLPTEPVPSIFTNYTPPKLQVQNTQKAIASNKIPTVIENPSNARTEPNVFTRKNQSINEAQTSWSMFTDNSNRQKFNPFQPQIYPNKPITEGENLWPVKQKMIGPKDNKQPWTTTSAKSNKRIAKWSTIAAINAIPAGLVWDTHKITKEKEYDMQMKYNNLKNIEQQIVNANTRGDVKGLEQAVTTWQQTIDSYGFKDYSLQRGTPVYNVLQEQQVVNFAGKPVGLFNNKIDINTTSSTTSTTNTQGAFIPPILKNHKVTNVNGNITTFDNGVIVIKDSSGDYIIQHPTNSLGMRLESYDASNKKQSDGFFNSNNYGYIGSYDEVVNNKTKSNTTGQTQTSTNQQTTKPNTTTANGRQPYSGNTSNYTPIDYNSEKGKQYMQRYNSVGNDWNRLHEDWKKANPTSTYSLEQFKALAHDNKYGPVHAFVHGYNIETPVNNKTTEIDFNSLQGVTLDNDIPYETDPIPTYQKPTATTTEEPTNNWNRWKEAAMFFNPARLAPIFNDLYNLSNQEGADPTLANSIRGAYTPIQAEQFGQQMAFTPFDWRANEIAQRAKAQSAQRTMMNIAGGNTAAATANLALQNAINQGDIAANYRQGIEYNNAQMATALGFNNQLDQANAMNRQQVNQANNANYMNSLINSAQVWDQEKKLIEQTRGQNQNMLAQNLGGLGQDYVNYNMINSNPAFLYSVMNSYKGNK